MSEFVLSAFADEYSPDIKEQINGLHLCGIPLIEPRGINGTSIADITQNEAYELAGMLSEANIGISAIGSPAGKVTTDKLPEHMEQYIRLIKTAVILGADRIRGFSFYVRDKNTERDKVMSALEKMVDLAAQNGILYCHENEKGIYGDDTESCLDIMENFKGGIGCVFDPANFIQCGVKPLEAFNALYPYITYIHIKDADENGVVTAAGEGIGNIPEMLGRLKRDKLQCILTLEPHLRIFEGLTSLEGGERTKLANMFTTSKEAFTYASDRLKAVLESL